MQNQSKYDPSRKTVGAIYRDAQMHGSKDPVTVGDMAAELKSSLVEDLNAELEEFPRQKEYAQFENRPYWVMIHESKDMAMPNAIRRRVLRTLYRPYPEDDTLVFWRSADRSEIRFCWQLPHWTEMENMLSSEELWQHNESDREYMGLIKAWKNFDLHAFGFIKNEIGKWVPNPKWEDKLMSRNHSSANIIQPQKLFF